ADHRRRGLPRHQPQPLPRRPRLQDPHAGPVRLLLPRHARQGLRVQGRHPRRVGGRPGHGGGRHGRPHRRRAAALQPRGHLHHRRRGHPDRDADRPRAGHPPRRPHLLDRRLRHPRPPPAARGRQARGGRPLRAGQDPGRDHRPGGARAGPRGADHPAEELRRAGAARRLRPPLRLGARRPQLPDDRQRREPLPVPRRRGPLPGDLPLPDAARGDRQRHVQRRRRRVQDDARGLPGRPRRRRPRQEGGRLPGDADDLGPAAAREAGRLAALQVGLRDGLEGLVRGDRQGPDAARLGAAVLQPGRLAAQLRLVQGAPRPVRPGQRRLPPRPVEAGRAGAGEEGLL
ncbi:MAG: UDP-glucose 4-epimerase, partial [uncultured Thermomicrobiales bacterium]